MDTMSRAHIRLHLTNITGVGASQLLHSLLPALERDPKVAIECVYLPDRGSLSKYRSPSPSTTIEVYRRFLPNVFSRILECTLAANHFNGEIPLLVMGDLPLRCRGPQIVFVQQSNLLSSSQSSWRIDEIKYCFARAIFAFNLHRARAFIVQTHVMREGLEKMYSSCQGKVHVIPQPVPSWLLESGLRRSSREQTNLERLRLIYPAAGYPHKNHSLLSKVDERADWPVKELLLTLKECSNPAPHLSWVLCAGFLSSAEMIEAYSRVDALLFLSKEESYGFPLIEAMFVGLPIVCPDLPYAHTLCGDQAIYFDPDNLESLLSALRLLQTRLKQGWWPNWKDSVEKIPRDWETVARQILKVACEI